MKRHRVATHLSAPALEGLEPRLLLSNAPVAVDDFFSVDEDTTLAPDPALVTITIDPDDFLEDTVLNNAVAGVTLTAEGGTPQHPITNEVFARTAPEVYEPDLGEYLRYTSTGTMAFARTPTTYHVENPFQWGDGFNNWLRAAFDQPASAVSVDFIADDDGDAGAVLRAFDAADNLLASAESVGSYTWGQVVTLTVEAEGIAYVLVEPDLVGLWHAWYLDNLVIEVAGGPAGVLANDTDADNDDLTAVLVDDVGHGTLLFNEDGSFEYTPEENFNGTDSFTYKANDGANDSNVATATITVNPVNDLPTAVADAAETYEVLPVAIDVLANDIDVDLFDAVPDVLSVLDVTNAANGIVAINSDGTVTYTPNAGFAGSDSFSYTLSDLAGETSTAAVDVTVHERLSISGSVWEDFNNDGGINFGEDMIAGVELTLTGTDFLGQAVSDTAVTDTEGVYAFIDLLPGEYAIAETQPADYEDGADVLGTVNNGSPGANTANDVFSGIELYGPGAYGENYNFAERPVAGGEVSSGQTAAVAFWQNKHGQALINELNDGPSSTQLANWLAATFPNMYGAGAGANDLTDMRNDEVADFYRSLFRQRKAYAGPAKLDAKVFSIALATYVTNETLAGTTAAAYGFTVTPYGVGTSTFNVGDNGEAFGVDDDSELTVLDLLLATNDYTVNGVLYDLDGDDLIDSWEQTLRTAAHDVYSQIADDGN